MILRRSLWLGVVVILLLIGGWLFLLNQQQHNQQRLQPSNIVDQTVVDEQEFDLDKLTNAGDSSYVQLAISPLNGHPISAINVNRRILGVMIENSLAARPQRGLSRADIVYEVVVEGGITRFFALFHGDDADSVGPIRSIRPYFLDWAKEYGAVLVHDGGSKIAMGMLATSHKELDDLAAGFFMNFFERDMSRRVSREHTLFSSTANLYQVVENQEWTEFEWPNVWQFSEKTPNFRAENVVEIVIPFSQKIFEVKYQFDQKRGKFLRFLADQEHVDDLDGQQIEVDNVVVLFTPIGLMGGENPLGWMYVETIGSGDAYFLRDGKLYEGKWVKDDIDSRIQFLIGEEEYILKPGKIWIHVFPQTRKKAVLWES